MNRCRLTAMFFFILLMLGLLVAACNPGTPPPGTIPSQASQIPSVTSTLIWVMSTPTPTPPASIASFTPTPFLTLMPSLIPTATVWCTPSPTPATAAHFTMVLMGIDNRPTGATWMTDTIMLFDINPEARTAAVLSIPRDLWFWTGIPGEPLRQVNRFYALAELPERGAGGEAVKEMLCSNLGVQADAYAVIGFGVFVRLIDAIGGIDIVLLQPISDPTYPDMNSGYDPLYIPSGSVHMDGDLALRYARTRHIDSDYGRIGRQQRLLMAIWDKLMQPDVWGRLISQAPDLWNELRRQVAIDQLMQLAMFARAVPPENIQMTTLGDGEGHVERYTLDDGRRVWAVVPDAADDFVRALFCLD
jgi:LCP family protein required for cell wall assembly